MSDSFVVEEVVRKLSGSYGVPLSTHFTMEEAKAAIINLRKVKDYAPYRISKVRSTPWKKQLDRRSFQN